MVSPRDNLTSLASDAEKVRQDNEKVAALDTEFQVMRSKADMLATQIREQEKEALATDQELIAIAQERKVAEATDEYKSAKRYLETTKETLGLKRLSRQSQKRRRKIRSELAQRDDVRGISEQLSVATQKVQEMEAEIGELRAKTQSGSESIVNRATVAHQLPLFDVNNHG